MAYPPYQHYKHARASGVTQLPRHWNAKRLRFAVRLNPSRNEVELPGDALVSFVPMDAVGELGGLTLEAERQLDEVGAGYTYFADGDVVVAKITPCFENGKGALASGLTNGVALGTTELHVIRPGPELEARFLFYLSISDHFRDIGESEMYGAGGQKRIPDTFIKDFRAGLPPLPEQHIIVAFLDRETARIDALIGKKRRLLELLEEKRLAVITHAVTKGLDPNAPMKDSGIDWLGQIPAHWDVTTPIKYLVKTVGGSTPSMANPLYWDGDVPWVSPKDMKKDVLDDTEDHVSQEALRETSLSLVREHAVLIVVRGMILAHTFPVATNLVPVTLNQDMKALQPDSRLSSDFLAWFLRGVSKHILSLVETSAHGTKALRTDQWNQLVVPLMPLEEQNALVSHIIAETRKIKSFASSIERQVALLQEYRSALITNAVTGKIDVRAEVV